MRDTGVDDCLFHTILTLSRAGIVTTVLADIMEACGKTILQYLRQIAFEMNIPSHIFFHQTSKNPQN